MNDEKIIQAAEAFVQDRLSGESTGHDWFHADRVRATSLTLQGQEGGDKLIVELAALLHDTGDRKVLGTEDDDLDIPASFLHAHHVGGATLDAVMHIIGNMSYSKSFGNPDIAKPIEFQIVQDADRLDALGAIGIARAFAFGGSKGRLLYDPAAVPLDFTSSTEYKQSESSTLHHFDEKLFKLAGSFNTSAAEVIAKERDAYMRAFYARFIQEWNGDL